MRAGAIAAALFFAGCCTPGPPSAPSAPSAPGAPAARGAPVSYPPRVWVLGGILEHPPRGRELWVTEHAISDVDASRRPLTVLALSGGRATGVGAALRPLLGAWPHGGAPLPVLFAALVPYETVFETLTTAGEAGFTRALLLVLRDGGERAIPIALPSAPTPTAEASLGLTITLTRAGAVVSSSGGTFAPGCDGFVEGGGVTVPTSPYGEPSVEAIERCVGRVKQAHPSEESAEIVAEPDVAFTLVARTLVAVQGTPDARLFPALTVGAAP